MERKLIANLKSGMDSCMRVLITLRNKKLNPKEFNMVGDTLIISMEESTIDEAFLNLSKLSDVNVTYNVLPMSTVTIGSGFQAVHKRG